MFVQGGVMVDQVGSFNTFQTMLLQKLPELQCVVQISNQTDLTKLVPGF